MEVQPHYQIYSTAALHNHKSNAVNFKAEPDASTPLKVPSYMLEDKSKIGNVNVAIACGNIIDVSADAYVVPEFQLGSSREGVGGTLHRNGFSGGLDNFDKYIKDNGEQKFGTVIMTESDSEYPSPRYLLHAVTVGISPEEAFNTVKNATCSALEKAQENGLKSVAMPALNTGIIGKLTHEESAQAMLAGIDEFAKNAKEEMDVCLVVYKKGQDLDDFVNTLKNKSYLDKSDIIGTKKFNPQEYQETRMLEQVMNTQHEIYKDR